MIIVDEKNELAGYLTDPARRVPKAHALTVCKAEQRSQFGASGVCRYIGKIPDGFVCAKHTPLKSAIDNAVIAGKYKRATGDNCEGFCGS